MKDLNSNYDARIETTIIEEFGVLAIISKVFKGIDLDSEVIYCDKSFRLDWNGCRVNVYMMQDRPNTLYMTSSSDDLEDVQYAINLKESELIPIKTIDAHGWIELDSYGKDNHNISFPLHRQYVQG